jgi:hypothetical protein
VPGASKTLSPTAAESIPAWMVGTSSGTRQVRAAVRAGKDGRRQDTASNAQRPKTGFRGHRPGGIRIGTRCIALSRDGSRAPAGWFA